MTTKHVRKMPDESHPFITIHPLIKLSKTAMPKGQHFKQYKITNQFIYAYDIIRLLTGYKFTFDRMIEYSYLTPPNHYKHIKFQSIHHNIQKTTSMRRSMANILGGSSITIITNPSSAIKYINSKTISKRKHPTSPTPINYYLDSAISVIS